VEGCGCQSGRRESSRLGLALFDIVNIQNWPAAPLLLFETTSTEGRRRWPFVNFFARLGI
jgi:hypothetical protein